MERLGAQVTATGTIQNDDSALGNVIDRITVLDQAACPSKRLSRRQIERLAPTWSSRCLTRLPAHFANDRRFWCGDQNKTKGSCVVCLVVARGPKSAIAVDQSVPAISCSWRAITFSLAG